MAEPEAVVQSLASPSLSTELRQVPSRAPVPDTVVGPHMAVALPYTAAVPRTVEALRREVAAGRRELAPLGTWVLGWRKAAEEQHRLKEEKTITSA